MEGKQYVIIGSNNFWYASCLPSYQAAVEELKVIKANHSAYADPETGHQPQVPEFYYIYEAREIIRIPGETNETQDKKD